MDLLKFSFQCKNYLCSSCIGRTEGKNCFSCKHMCDWPCNRRKFNPKNDEIVYQEFIEYIRRYSKEARKQFYEYDDIYELEIQGCQALIDQANPDDYYIDFGNGTGITQKQLPEYMKKARVERALRLWNLRIFQMPDTVKEIEDKLKSKVKCKSFIPIIEDDNPVQNCFMCRQLFNKDNGAGCNCWFKRESKRGQAQSESVYVNIAKIIINLLNQNQINTDMSLVEMYLDRFDAWHKNEEQKWKDFKLRILGEIVPSPDMWHNIIKNLKQLEQRTPSEEYKSYLQNAIIMYEQSLSEHECNEAKQKATKPIAATTVYRSVTPSTPYDPNFPWQQFLKK